MAAHPSQANITGSRQISQFADLPQGCCNFRDLSAGTDAPRCGCYHFWLNSSHLQAESVNLQLERAWCFCGHHACYHTWAGPRSENEQTVSTVPISRGVVGKSGHDNPMWTSVPRTPSAERMTGLGINHQSQQQTPSMSSRNARVWEALNGFARAQEIAQQPFTRESMPSTAPPSTMEDQRRSPVSVMRELQQQKQLLQQQQSLKRSMGPPPLQIPTDRPTTSSAHDEYSATEVATPSIHDTPNFHKSHLQHSQARDSPSNLRPSTFFSPTKRAQQSTNLQVMAQSGYVRPDVNHHDNQHMCSPISMRASQIIAPVSLRDMHNVVQTLGRRIDALENMSFSHVPVEVVQDKFELMDSRLLELEHWRTDREDSQAVAEEEMAEAKKTSAETALQALQTDSPASTSSSEHSFDSRAAAYTEAAILATLAANSETAPCLAALENRIADLESAALPTLAQPWKLEVVLLPWGRELRGVWFSSAESTEQYLGLGTQLSEEWTPAPSQPKISFKGSNGAGWTTESIEAWAQETQVEWLSPKACGPSGTVFQRLESRGLVQDIVLTASDAHHVLQALHEAFAPILGDLEPIEGPLADRFLGLCENLVPLRKVRKSSRLRFLSPAEMITPALWTASFLDESVCMKLNDGPRRIYVTTPEAYLQAPSNDEDWTWPRIRDLPLFNASEAERALHESRHAIEAVWSHNDRLDRVPGKRSFAATPESQWTTSSGHSPLPSAQLDPHSNIGAAPNVLMPKRRVVSADSRIAVQSSADSNVEPFFIKRRRLSDPSDAERGHTAFTPRWSREPPSPYTSELTIEVRSQGVGARKRGNTPFAYATPHSHNQQYAERSDFRMADGDTEAGTDFGGVQSVRIDEEWEGVDEGMTGSDSLAQTFGQQQQETFYEHDDNDNDDGDNSM